jgi:hypothetical protein
VLTHTFSNNVRDATVVVDGAGPGTLLITVSASGHDEFWLDGVRYRDSGHVVFRFSVHHNGTLTDAEDDFGFVFLGIVKPSTGTNEGADLSFDPCSTLGELV